MKVQEELKAYIDGELKPEEAKQVQEQVEASDELAQEVAFLKLLGQEIREMVHEPAVDGATETLEAVARHPRMSRWRIWGGAFGLAATLILIAQLPGLLARVGAANDSGTVAMATMRSPMSASGFNRADEAATGKAGSPSTAGEMHDDLTITNHSSAAKAAAPIEGMAGAGFGPSTVTRHGSFGGSGRGTGTWIIPAPRPEKELDGDETNGTIALKGSPTVNGSLYASQNDLLVRKQGYQENGYERVGHLQASPKALPQVNASVFAAQNNAKLLQRAPAQPARMVIQNGTLDLYVANVTEFQNRAINLAKGVGGFVANSSFSGGNPDVEDDTPSAQIELRVPVLQFTNVMARLRQFAATPKDIKSDQVSGNDVTAQYADDEGRLRELHAEENDYVEMLKKVRHMDDILSLKDRLSSVRQDISGYESQVATLKDQSAMSTIDLTLETTSKPKPPAPKPKAKNWAESAWDSAEATRSDALKTIAGLGIFLVAWSPIWLPIGIGAWWMTRKTR